MELPPARTPSKLNIAVGLFKSDWLWRVRTALAILCAVGVVCWDAVSQLEHSSVVLMFLLDCTLLSYIMLAPRSSDLAAIVHPLGAKVSLLKIPLSFIHASSANWFDTVCLLLRLVTLFLRDIFFMVFIAVSLKCIFHFWAMY